ncbi:MAG TPA: helix-turn-helix domain-containing protein [Baekduia sp.]|nr:helix-turn-helix domain-containing protein [Baekduia sp.]
MQRTRFGDMTCSIARTTDVIGEPWSPLILRDVWVGINRFDLLQSDLGISSKVLTERLKWLVAQGVIERRAYQERPQRFEYILTEKGSELCAILMAMTAWGDKHLAGPEGVPALLKHKSCGHHMHAEVRCSHCGEELRGADVAPEPGPAMLAELGR